MTTLAFSIAALGLSSVTGCASGPDVPYNVSRAQWMDRTIREVLSNPSGHFGASTPEQQWVSFLAKNQPPAKWYESVRENWERKIQMNCHVGVINVSEAHLAVYIPKPVITIYPKETNTACIGLWPVCFGSLTEDVTPPPDVHYPEPVKTEFKLSASAYATPGPHGIPLSAVPQSAALFAHCPTTPKK